MAGGGNRYDPGIVKASDLLPTAETVALAKGFAGRACADHAADAVWMSRESAHTWIERTPILALAALAKVCPEVAVVRLARCLGLDPVAAPESLKVCTEGHARWPLGAMSAVVAQQIVGGV